MILECAEHLFAEQGYAATSLRHIGEAAGLNPALVSYHFGGKFGLLEAVFEQALRPLSITLEELRETGSAPPEVLLSHLHTLAGEHPKLLPLMVREALLPGGAMREVFAERFAPRLGGLFPALVRGEQQRGALAQDTDPEALSVLLLAMGVFPYIAMALVEQVIGLNLQAGGADRLAAQARRLLQRGLAP
jgi:AcrR family transcriptional regulator